MLPNHLEIIKGSPMNIPQRLSALYPGFAIVRNRITHRFEVHDITRKEFTLELNLPFDELDYRTIQYVQEHDRKFAHKIFEEIEKQEEKAELELAKKRKDVTDTIVRDLYSYVNKHESKETVDLSDSKLYSDAI